MLTYQCVPSTPGRRWCGRSHCQSARGRSLYKYETLQQWPPRPLGFVIGRIWTHGDAVALEGIPYRALLRKKEKVKIKSYTIRHIVCLQNVTCVSVLHPSSLTAGKETGTMCSTKEFIVRYWVAFYRVTRHVCSLPLSQYILLTVSQPELLARSWHSLSGSGSVPD